MKIQISKANHSDLDTIERIARQTFIETYAKMNSNANMEMYLNKAFNQKKLENELVNPESTFYLVKSAKKVIGYLKINEGNAQTEFADLESIEIERIYISKIHQGQGLGRVLIEKAIDLAKFKGKSNIWLGVWRQNRNAIQFYEKLGFEKSGSHVFVFGTERQTDYIMRKKL